MPNGSCGQMEALSVAIAYVSTRRASQLRSVFTRPALSLLWATSLTDTADGKNHDMGVEHGRSDISIAVYRGRLNTYFCAATTSASSGHPSHPVHQSSAYQTLHTRCGFSIKPWRLICYVYNRDIVMVLMMPDYYSNSIT